MSAKQAQAQGIASVIRETEESVEIQIRRAESFLQISRRYLDDLRRLDNRPINSSSTRHLSPKAPIIDFVLDFLEEQGSPQSDETIIQNMISRGVNAGLWDQRQQIKKSLDYHLLSEKEKSKKWKHVKAKPPKLMRFGDLIGKAEWKKEDKSPGEKK
ncbi:MAG TPA: hypothetical protein VKY85_01145 [Candidatus Angelobacter sp.]|nr:hypothetical protein [Candidatus Angelobacter sp.]